MRRCWSSTDWGGGTNVKRRDGLSSFLDSRSRFTWLKDCGGTGPAKHVGGSGVVAMVGMFVIAGEGCVFEVLEEAVCLTVVGDTRAKVGGSHEGWHGV